MPLPVLIVAAMLGQIARYPPAFRYSPVAPYVPTTEQFEDYPLHIRILEARWNFDRGTYIGFGRADLLGSETRGFDFTYSCGEPFKTTEIHGEFYAGKWKRPEQQLEILLQQVGSSHTTRCTLKTALKPVPFSPDSAAWETSSPTPPPPAGPTRPVLHATPPAQPQP